MARRPLHRVLILIAIAAPGAFLACVGDSPVTPPPGVDASTDSTTPTPDASGGNDAQTSPDTGIDAGPCSNAIPGNALALPTSGSSLIPQGGGPFLAGDYVLTQMRADCIPCDLKPGSVIAGIHVDVSGATYTIQRRITYQIGGQPQVQVLDRWSGTYDQLNAKVSMTQVCPQPGSPTTWQAYLPVSSDGGADLVVMRFGSEFKTQKLDGGADAGPTLTWFFTRK